MAWVGAEVAGAWADPGASRPGLRGNAVACMDTSPGSIARRECPRAAEYLPGLFTVRGCRFVAIEHFKFRLESFDNRAAAIEFNGIDHRPRNSPDCHNQAAA